MSKVINSLHIINCFRGLGRDHSQSTNIEDWLVGDLIKELYNQNQDYALRHKLLKYLLDSGMDIEYIRQVVDMIDDKINKE